MKTKLSRTSERLIKELEEAAQVHGWEKDQGWGARAGNAQAAFERTGAALRARIARLERDVVRFRKERPHVHCRDCAECEE